MRAAKESFEENLRRGASDEDNRRMAYALNCERFGVVSRGRLGARRGICIANACRIKPGEKPLARPSARGKKK